MAVSARVADLAFVLLAAAAPAVATSSGASAPSAPPASSATRAASTTPLVVELTGVPKPAPRVLDAARVEAGRKLYVARCQGCHGVTGAGDGPVGRLLKPKPQVFSDALWQARVTDDELHRVIALGGAAVQKAASMPATKDLAPDAVDAVVAFVRSLRAPYGTVRVTVLKADGGDVVVNLDANADGGAQVTLPGVSGRVAVSAVVDGGGAPACTIDVAEAAGARVACVAKTK